MSNNAEIQEKIIEAMLPDVPFDGWSMRGARKAAIFCGYEGAMADAVFPGGLGDVLDCFSGWADGQMMLALKSTKVELLRVRERIGAAVMARFEALRPYREAERLALAYWAVPTRSVRAARILWRTADRIWVWAGDTATDYNRYTKRGLLSGVMGSAMMVFLEDESEDLAITRAFLERRIGNVMQLGKVLGRIKKAS